MRDAVRRIRERQERAGLERKRRLGAFHLPRSISEGATFIVMILAAKTSLASAWSWEAGWTNALVYAGCVLGVLNLAIVLTWAWPRRARAAEHRVANETWASAINASFSFCMAGLIMHMASAMHYTGSDWMRWIEVTPDRTGLVVASEVKMGFADRVLGMLDENPGIRTVHLMSYGGLGHEIDRVADAIHERGIDTVAIGHCYSACTFLHGAGRRRLVVEGTENPLGYHSGGRIVLPAHWNETGYGPWGIFLRAGYKPDFVGRLRTVPHHDLWEPDRRTLSENGATTGEVSPYDTVGLRWLVPGGLDKDEYLEGWRGRILERAPAAKAAIGVWSRTAWAAARNGSRVAGYRLSYLNRTIALGLSMPEAPDHAVRRATDYLLAGMYAARDHEKEKGERSCARIGAALDFGTARYHAPTPPGAGTDPSDPWGIFIAQALSRLPEGWEAAVAGLPDVHAPETWSAPRPGPYPPCSEFTRWFEAALADGGDGIARIRARFRQFAQTPSNGMLPDDRVPTVSASLR